MARLFAFAAALAAVTVQFAAAAIEEEDGVLVLTSDNFEEAVTKHNPLLVEFYAPWCGHCKKLVPEYAAAAKKLAADNLKIGKVDATIHKDLAETYAIQGFPTLKFFRGSVENPGEYNGGRTSKEIVDWVTKKAGPVTKPIANADAVAAALKDNSVIYLGFFNDATSPAAKAFEQAAAGRDDVVFGITSSDALRATYGIAAGEEGVVSLNTFPEQENAVTFTGPLASPSELASFVDANALPLVIAFTPESAQKIFRGAIKTHYLLFVDPAVAATKEAESAFRHISKANAGKAMFVTVDPAQDRVASYFGVKKEDYPAAVIVTMPDNGAMKKYAYPKQNGFTEEALSAFFGEWAAGKVKPFLKSAAAPEAAAEAAAPVKTIVGSNFESVVLAPGKDVLLEFYAPWCGHCKSLAPKYEELGTSLAGSPNVVIAKIDATENEVDYPGVNVRGFPTILLFKDVPSAAGTKTVVEFDGDRSVEGFKAFLAKNAAHGLGAAAEDAEDKEEL